MELRGANPASTHTRTASHTADQPYYASWFNGGSGTARYIVLELWWGTGSTNIVKAEFWSDGAVFVYVDGVLQAEGSIGAPQGGTGIQGVWQDALLIPITGHGLLITSPVSGGGFLAPLPLLTGGAVTAAGNLQWRMGTTGHAALQLHVVKFASGNLVSRLLAFRLPPASGATSTVRLIGATPATATTPTPAFRTATDSGAFSPDGSTQTCRIRVPITGGARSPFVFAVAAEFDPAFASTSAVAATNLQDYVLAASLSVPDGGPSELSFGIRAPAALQTAGAAKLDRVSNRAVSAVHSSIEWFSGRTGPIEWRDDYDDSLRDAVIRCQDAWRALENYAFSDPIPLDGLTVSEAFEYLASCAGYSGSALDIETLSLVIGDGHRPGKAGDFAFVVEIGETAAQAVDRLTQAFVANWFVQFRPTATGVKFQAKSETALGTTSKALVYRDQTTAPSATDPVWQSRRQTSIEPQATDVFVLGIDPVTGRAIRSSYEDSAAKDPTTAPASRPDNWLGEAGRKAGILDSAISSQAIADDSRDLIVDRVTGVVYLNDWLTDMLFDGDGVPIWRGDVVDLEGVGKFRVLAIDGEGIVNSGELAAFDVNYTGRFIGASEIE